MSKGFEKNDICQLREDWNANSILEAVIYN